MASTGGGSLRLSRRSVIVAVGVVGTTIVAFRVAVAAQRVLGWILVAVVVAGLVHPVVSRLESHMPRGVAVLVVMVALTGTLAVVGYGLIDNLLRETHRLQQFAPDQARRLEHSPRFGEAARELQLEDRTRSLLQNLPDRLRGGSPAEALRSAATRGVAYLTTTILTIFMLLHGPRILAAASAQIHDEERRSAVEALAWRVYLRAFAYARSTIVTACAAGLFAYVAAKAAGVPAPVPLAVWVALWNLVPVAGAAVGALPIVILAAVTSATDAAILIAAFGAYQTAENLVVLRRVEAATVRVGPFLTLVGGLVGFELSGLAGALLGVLAMVVGVTITDELAPTCAVAKMATGTATPAS